MISAKKRFIESTLQSLDQPFSGVDSYYQALNAAKDKRDSVKRFWQYYAPWKQVLPSVCGLNFFLIGCRELLEQDGQFKMCEPLERVARVSHMCGVCERPFSSAEEEDKFLKKVYTPDQACLKNPKTLSIRKQTNSTCFPKIW